MLLAWLPLVNVAPVVLEDFVYLDGVCVVSAGCVVLVVCLHCNDVGEWVDVGFAQASVEVRELLILACFLLLQHLSFLMVVFCVELQSCEVILCMLFEGFCKYVVLQSWWRSADA